MYLNIGFICKHTNKSNTIHVTTDYTTQKHTKHDAVVDNKNIKYKNIIEEIKNLDLFNIRTKIQYINTETN